MYQSLFRCSNASQALNFVICSTLKSKIVVGVVPYRWTHSHAHQQSSIAFSCRVYSGIFTSKRRPCIHPLSQLLQRDKRKSVYFGVQSQSSRHAQVNHLPFPHGFQLYTCVYTIERSVEMYEKELISVYWTLIITIRKSFQ